MSDTDKAALERILDRLWGNGFEAGMAVERTTLFIADDVTPLEEALRQILDLLKEQVCVELFDDNNLHTV